MNEVDGAARWIYSTLAGDSALTTLLGAARIYRDVGPQEAAWPVVTFGLQSGGDTVGNAGARILTRMRWLVKSITKGTDLAAVAAIAARVDVLLQQGAGVNGDAQVAACVREQVISYPHTEAGVVWRHEGGVYRVEVHPS